MSKIRNAFIKLGWKYSQWRKQRQLKIKDFSIISNNCWAATAVYQPFGLKYNTPTVGLFFMDEDYIRFLENLEFYLSADLRFIDTRESKYYNKITDNGKRQITYPIAQLGGDVEIHFMHYHSKEEAAEKWGRRTNRINRENLLIKMSLRDSGYDVDSILERFKALPYKNKICFTADREDSTNGILRIPELSQLNLVGGDETDLISTHLNMIKFLNSTFR